LTHSFVDPDFQETNGGISEDDDDTDGSKQDSDENQDGKRKRQMGEFLSKKKAKVGREDVAALRKVNLPTSSIRGTDEGDRSQTGK
jgi:hypothetical protein